MEFRFEDIIRNIIPGIVATTCFIIAILVNYDLHDIQKILASDLKEYSEILLVFFLVFSYIIGYLLDALSSILEYYIIYSVFGTPSLNLLKGKGRRIQLVNYEEITENIVKKCYPPETIISFHNNFKEDSKTCKLLFKHANDLKNKNDKEDIKELIKEYYYAYLFARNLFFATLISFLFLIVSLRTHISPLIIIVMCCIILILLFRRRDRAYYYSRQVLLASNF